MDERLIWPGWLTYSRRFTDISGHPSATCLVQDGKVRRPRTDVLPLYHKKTRYSLIIIIVAYLGSYSGFHACIIVRNKAVVDNKTEQTASPAVSNHTLNYMKSICLCNVSAVNT